MTELRCHLTLERGEFDLDLAFTSDAPLLGIFGPSGAGKSTLLAWLAGLIPAGAGRLTVDGETLFDSAAGVMIPPERRRIGVVFQDARLFPHMTVEANLRFGMSGRRGALGEIPALLKIEHLLGSSAKRLSGGEARRVALARTILAQPRLILLDEPLAGLDGVLRGEVLRLLAEVQGATAIPMLLVSHDLPAILDLTERLLVLERGRALGIGRYGDLVQEERVRRALGHAGLFNLLRLRVAFTKGGITYAHPILPEGERTRLAGGGRLPLIKLPEQPTAIEGEEIHAALRAEEISLARQPIAGISIQNQIAARVERLIPDGGRVLALLDVGFRLLVELTRESTTLLDLTEDAPVWCLFKTGALRRVR